MKRFLIADLHYGHKNIIDYESRPFENTHEMDKILTENWNKTIGKNDKVYVLGDFSFSNATIIKSILEKLNGYKILVMGNHDRGHSVSWWLGAGFNEVSENPIIVDDFYMLSHEPLYINKNMPYANIFGHVHGSPLYQDYSSNSFCVSVERINYTPINFDEVKRLILSSNLPISREKHIDSNSIEFC